MSELMYKRSGDYLFPEMELTKEEQRPLRKYGLMRLRYLENERPGLYTRLLLSGKLMEHLREIEQTAQNRLERLMILLPNQNGVTEELKATNQMAWVAQMNSLKHQAEEMILSDLIYA
ncbi:MAG TPA: TnpV protein [Clostridiales bacterium]|nr:TnpV protein [Clostridiales bacterium]HCV68767.1 TnpV protein [Clostridiales bacterium]